MYSRVTAVPPTAINQTIRTNGKRFMAVYAAACTAGGWYMIDSAGVASATQNPTLVANATIAIKTRFGVAQATRATAGLVWMQVAGPCDAAYVDGTAAVAIGDQLQCVDLTEAAVLDTGTAMTADSVAIALEAQAVGAPVLIKVFIHDRTATIG